MVLPSDRDSWTANLAFGTGFWLVFSAPEWGQGYLLQWAIEDDKSLVTQVITVVRGAAYISWCDLDLSNSEAKRDGSLVHSTGCSSRETEFRSSHSPVASNPRMQGLASVGPQTDITYIHIHAHMHINVNKSFFKTKVIILGINREIENTFTCFRITAINLFHLQKLSLTGQQASSEAIERIHIVKPSDHFHILMLNGNLRGEGCEGRTERQLLAPCTV